MINADYKTIKNYIDSLLFDLDKNEMELLDYIIKSWIENIESFQQGKMDIKIYKENPITREMQR